MKELIIFGAGGHAAVVLDALMSHPAYHVEFVIKGLLDDSNKLSCLNIPVIGRINDAKKLASDKTEFVIAIGNNAFRRELQDKFSELVFATVVHPSAIIASHVELGAGSMVLARAVISPNVKIGRHVIVNTGAIVEHDNVIADFVHVSPQATLCGGVRVQDSTHIGANVTIIPGVCIGANAVVGAGATVISNVMNEDTVVGTPAKSIRK